MSDVEVDWRQRLCVDDESDVDGILCGLSKFAFSEVMEPDIVFEVAEEVFEYFEPNHENCVAVIQVLLEHQDVDISDGQSLPGSPSQHIEALFAADMDERAFAIWLPRILYGHNHEQEAVAALMEQHKDVVDICSSLIYNDFNIIDNEVHGDSYDLLFTRLLEQGWTSSSGQTLLHIFAEHADVERLGLFVGTCNANTHLLRDKSGLGLSFLHLLMESCNDTANDIHIGEIINKLEKPYERFFSLHALDDAMVKRLNKVFEISFLAPIHSSGVMVGLWTHAETAMSHDATSGRFLRHGTNQGSTRENAWINGLRRVLPSNLTATAGEIVTSTSRFDSKEKRKQLDCILSRRGIWSTLVFVDEPPVCVHADSVFSVCEVKSTLHNSYVVDQTIVKDLTRAGIHRSTLTMLVAFKERSQHGKLPQQRLDTLRKGPHWDVIVVPGQWAAVKTSSSLPVIARLRSMLVANFKQTVPFLENGDLSFLHDLDGTEWVLFKSSCDGEADDHVHCGLALVATLCCDDFGEGVKTVWKDFVWRMVLSFKDDMQPVTVADYLKARSA